MRRQKVQWPPRQESPGSRSPSPMILRSQGTVQPRPWQATSPSTRKPPTSSGPRTPGASRPGAHRFPANSRSGPRTPVMAPKPTLGTEQARNQGKKRVLEKAETTEPSQSKQRQGSKATSWLQTRKTKSAPSQMRSQATPTQIIIAEADSTSRPNSTESVFVSRCPRRLFRFLWNWPFPFLIPQRKSNQANQESTWSCE